MTEQLLAIARDADHRDVVLLDQYEGSAYIRVRGETFIRGQWVPDSKRSITIRIRDLSKIAAAFARAEQMVANGSFPVAANDPAPKRRPTPARRVSLPEFRAATAPFRMAGGAKP